jgi:hypothetical protein
MKSTGRPRVIAAGLAVVCLAACGGDSSAVPDTPSSTTGDPVWCISSKVMDHHVEIADQADRVGDPRAGDPGWVYLEIRNDAVWIPGPTVPTAGMDTEVIRDHQRWGTDGSDGTVAVLVAGDDLEYRVFVPDYPGYVLEVVPLEAELCAVDGAVTSRFALAAADPANTGVLHSVTIEAEVDGSVVGVSEPITIEAALGR